MAPVLDQVLFVASAVVALFAALLFWMSRVCVAGHRVDSDDVVLVVFVSIVTVTIATGWMGVVLASLGLFALGGLGVFLCVVAALLVAASRVRRIDLPHVQPKGSTAVLVVLVALCFIVYFRPHEYILGGSDAGTYVNIAGAVARTGDFVIHDDWQQMLVEHASVTMRQQPEQLRTRYLQFVGWYADDRDPGRIVPQFFPLHPTLLAVGAGLAGIKGSLLVTPLWGVLDIIAVYLLSRRLFGSRVAVLSALLLAATPTQIWFARYPTTEPLTLLLVFSALLGLHMVWDDRRRVDAAWGAFGGAALGAACLARIDLPIVLLLVLGFLAWRWLRRRWSPGMAWFLGALVPLTLHATVSALAISWPYAWNTYRSVLQRLSADSLEWLVVGAISFVLAVFTASRSSLSRRYMPEMITLVRRYERSLRLVVVCLTCALSLYAYFVRPYASEIGYVTSWPLGDEFPVLNSHNWLRMGWYLTPLGLLLATLGAASMIHRESFWRLGPFLAVGLLTTLQYQYDVFNTSYHIYVMRRFFPIVIPTLIVFAAYAVVGLAKACGRRVCPQLGAWTILLLLGGLLYQSRFVLPQRDFAGLLDQLGELASVVADDAVILIVEPQESAFADHFGVPLRFIFDHRIATIRTDTPDVEPALRTILDYAKQKGLPVQLLAWSAVPERVQQTLELVPETGVSIDTQVLESTYFSYPSRVLTVRWDLDVYTVEMDGSSDDLSLPGGSVIDIGGIDTLYVSDGFYAKELAVAGAESIRWTGNNAVVHFPSEPGERWVRLRVMTPLLDGYEPAAVSVVLDSHVLGEFVPTPGQWSTVEFRGSASPKDGRSRLELITETFSPRAYGLSDDARDLGVMVDWIDVARIQSVGP